MNAWYARYPGDYGRDTAHLSMIQHGAYTLLLDHYYSTAAPLPADVAALYRICRAFDENERKAVDFIVSQFFELRTDGYHNQRADVELARRAEQHERLSSSGRRGAQKRWLDSQAISPAISPVVASPQPQPQPQKEKEKTNTAPAAHCGVVPVAVWLAFVEMRKKIRKPLTERAGELIRDKLRQFQQNGEDPVRVLEQSIMNSWAGVFSVKERRGDGKKLTGDALTEANLKAAGLIQ